MFLKRLALLFDLAFSASKSSVVGIVVSQILAGTLPTAIAWIGKRILDKVATSETHIAGPKILTWILAECLLVATLGVALKVSQISFESLRLHFGHHMLSRLTTKYAAMPLIENENPAVLETLLHLKRDTWSKPLTLVLALGNGIKHLLLFTVAWFLLLPLGPSLLGIVLLFSLPVVILEWLGWDHGSSKHKHDILWKERSYLEHLLSRDESAKEIKLLGIESHLLDRFHSLSLHLAQREAHKSWRHGMIFMGLGMMATFGIYMTYTQVIFKTMQGSLSLGTMAMMLILLRQIQHAVIQLSNAWASFKFEAGFMDSYAAFMSSPEDTRPLATSQQHPSPLDGSLRFENVSFRYPGAQESTLHSVSFSISAGEKISVVGDNGSGKTTLLKLALGLYLPTSGRVIVGGTDTRDLKPYPAMASIFQDHTRFKMRAKEAVGLSHLDQLEQPRVIQSATLGLSKEMIEALPKQFEAALGKWHDEGHELSGGQWQRVALSRMFYPNAKILVLDEPSASLDPESEAMLLQHLKQHEATMLLVSHRPKLLELCTRKFTLQHGRLV